MKATINREGALIISSESGLESYALDKWMKDNWDNCNGTLKPNSNRKFRVELSDYEYKQKIHPNFLKI